MKGSSCRLSPLLALCQFTDSTLPIGAFAFSNGLESAIQLGIVSDEPTLSDYIAVMLKQTAYLDGVYINHAYQLSAANDIEGC